MHAASVVLTVGNTAEVTVTALHDARVSMNFDSISVSATRGAIQTGATRLEETAADVYSCSIGAPSSTRDAARGDADRDRKVS